MILPLLRWVHFQYVIKKNGRIENVRKLSVLI